jgi:phage terminase large subunit-like protein
MISYSNGIISGEIIACEKNKQACLRFLNDLDRAKKNLPEFPYEFVSEKAEQFEKWCGLFKHTKGVLAGKPIVLAPVLHFVAGNIYGWYHKETGLRRFTKSYWQVARKNAKSQANTMIGTYELFVISGEEQAEVYTAATKKEQANIIYNEAVTVLNRCEYINKGDHYSVKYGKIERLSTGGFMRSLSKEDKKSGDGYNPSCGLVDEYHAHPTEEIYNIIDSGMGARAQPLLSIITTAGYELSYPCYRIEYALISKILDPANPINIDTYFVMVNELDCNNTGESIEIGGRKVAPGDPIDDINNPDVWAKANPILCSYPEGVKFIKDRLEIAKNSPDKMRDFLTKTMNVWVNKRALGYMDLARWVACSFQGDFFKELKNKTDLRCWVGMDLSARLDLTSVSFEFVGDDEKYYIFSHSFIPEDAFHDKIKADKVPYDLWEKNGWLTVTAGSVVDYRHVKKYVIDTASEKGWFIEEVCVDPWGATQVSSDFQDDGYTVVEISQTITTLSEPTKEFRYMVYSGRVVHQNSPVLAWAMGNAVTKTDHNENMILNKQKSTQRIDPVAAVINSHARAIVKDEEADVYEARGMRSLQ